MDSSGETQRQISTCLLDLSNKIERLIVSHTELAENITKLKEAVYNPDEGIYARIRELEREIVKNGEVRMAKIEDTIVGVKKLQWMVIGTTVAAVVAVLFKTLSL
mgnify:FL=1|tara:strand:+ start:319 stop:633 length:315 start_codon:yes stop_codon:yes gene_type:complete